MSILPHYYSASAHGRADGEVALQAAELPTLSTAAPAEFGGPGDRWSPETLLVGAVADCFVLTFRAVARAARLPWSTLRCEVVGTLDRVHGVTQFSHFSVRATLVIPAGAAQDEASQALERADRGCLIRNSLKGTTDLEIVVQVAP